MLREQIGGSGEGLALIPASGSNCPLRYAAGAVAASGSGSGYQKMPAGANGCALGDTFLYQGFCYSLLQAGSGGFPVY